MRTEHFEILVEEPSMEAFLVQVLPKFIGKSTFTIHTHQGKIDFLRKLESRLRGYARWLPNTTRIIVLVDRDDDDCKKLKRKLESDANNAGLATGTRSKNSWQVLNRIVIEELEAWYFGNWPSVCQAFPRLRTSVINQAAYRKCDAITGGTWQALERVLQRDGYFAGGLRKVEAAQRIGEHFDHTACVSPSFIAFRDVVVEAVTDAP